MELYFQMNREMEIAQALIGLCDGKITHQMVQMWAVIVINRLKM